MNNKVFEAALANVFFNGRGEFCTNGATSRSKVAKARRKDQERAVLRAKLDSLLSDLKRRGRTNRLVARIAECQRQLNAL
jgi:hypothetical protein